MNTKRFFEAMAFKLSLDQKKLDDKLERVVNSDTTLEDKMVDFERVLQKMVNLEGLVTKFNEVIQSNNNNDADITANETKTE